MIIVARGGPGAEVAARAGASGKPVLEAELVPDAAVAATLKAERVYAFYGIARPEKFYATLADLGAEIDDTSGFSDHHRYSRTEIGRLQNAAKRLNALPVATEKDFVGVAGLADPNLPPLACRPQCTFRIMVSQIGF